MNDNMRTLADEKDICVLATLSPNGPHQSLMAYVRDAETGAFVMFTETHTAKWTNMQRNPNVSLLIDSREEDLPERRDRARAMTVKGRHVTPEPAEMIRLRQLFLLRHPHMKEFADRPEATMIHVVPRNYLLLTGLEQAEYAEV